MTQARWIPLLVLLCMAPLTFLSACDKLSETVSSTPSPSGSPPSASNPPTGDNNSRPPEEKMRVQLTRCRNYLMATNPKPEDLSGVKKACAEKSSHLPDPDYWGNAPLYTPDPDGGNKFKLYSAGPDGQPDTADDIHPAADKDNKK